MFNGESAERHSITEKQLEDYPSVTKTVVKSLPLEN